MESLKILIGADICVTESNKDAFIKGDLSSVIDDNIREILERADARIFNLEGPLTDIVASIEKNGPNLIMPRDSVNGILTLKPSLLTLANNHIMDQGISGLWSTIDCLKNNDIDYVGVGENISAAKEPFVFEIKGRKIGVYACAEHEFSIANENTPGANSFDPLTSLDDIEKLKKECDYLIVLYHGGKEYYRYPSPYIQRLFRRMADKGADLVIAQHTHCIGCEEKYNGSLLVYGQGNFIFDDGDDEFWNNGMLIGVRIGDNTMEYEYYPFIKEQGKIYLVTESTDNDLMKGYRERSSEIADIDKVRENYNKYIEKKLETYLRILNGNSFWFKVVNRLTGRGLIYKIHKKRGLLKVLNLIECEAHRELIIAGIKNKVF